eukprot:scaffold32802_cov61-Phaeocystis_antarctica.AAC.8
MLWNAAVALIAQMRSWSITLSATLTPDVRRVGSADDIVVGLLAVRATSYERGCSRAGCEACEGEPSPQHRVVVRASKKLGRETRVAVPPSAALIEAPIYDRPADWLRPRAFLRTGCGKQADLPTGTAPRSRGLDFAGARLALGRAWPARAREKGFC